MSATPDESASEPLSLPIALLLSATGGLLDAATWVLRGRVFATALTGNVILLGLAALTRSPAEILAHVAPILGFFAGAIASSFTRARLGRRAHAGSLLLEVAVLGAAGLLPSGFPNGAFTAVISFAGALQVASFRRAGPFSFSSTFLTGDIQETAEALYNALTASTSRTRARARLHTLILAAVCLCFLIGAILGAFASHRLGAKTYWLPAPILLALVPVTLRNSPPVRT